MIPVKKLKLGFSFKEKKFKRYHLILESPAKNKQIISLESLRNMSFFSIQAMKTCYMTERQIISFLKLLKKELRVLSPKVKVRSFLVPYFTCTRKPKDIRMGRGKGVPTLRVFPVVKGSTLFEVKNILNLDLIILNNLFKKLPIPVKLCSSSSF